MPIVNHVVLASGAIAVVAVAMAMYESPELRRYADDIRRRIAVALHCMGDNVEPPHREPRFNRPEDADGFMQSRRGAGAEPGVDADDETRRRQRDELLYWNQLLLDKKAREGQPERDLQPWASSGCHGPSFDDFLRRDETADHGTYVFNTGADVRGPGPTGGLRLRGAAPRGLAASTSPYANPFADEYHIGSDEVADVEADAQRDGAMAPAKDEIMSDIYSATTRDPEEPTSPGTLTQSSPALIDVAPGLGARAADLSPSATLERELSDDEFLTAGQDDRHEAYASIQAWAQESSRDFYSPLPVTPAAPVSEPEMVSDGQLTPTDSAGSGVDVADEVQSTSEDAGQAGDVMSESDGMLTPASWSEVGSLISESDAYGPMRA